MHRLFIVNPNASGGRALSKIQSMKLYEHGRVLITKYPGHAEELAREGGYDEIVSVGGDGTAHEVLNGIMKSGQDIIFSAIPGGTGNDFLRNFGPVIEENGEVTRVDVGYIPELDEYFLNTSDMGFATRVVRQTVAKPFRRLTYVLSVLSNLIKFHPEWMEFSIKGKDYSGYFFQLDICNGRFYGGGMKISPFSELHDGKLDILFSPPLKRREVISLLPKIYEGRHINDKRVKYMRAKKIVVYSKNWINADGEIVGESPATFMALRKRLKLRIFYNGK